LNEGGKGAINTSSLEEWKGSHGYDANSENKQQQAQPEGNKNENLSEDLALNRLS